MLDGDLVIQGSGDPKLVLERIWLLLRRVQQLGVREIHGDIVLDRSAFEVAPTPPGDFDGEALRPYNVGADALLLNYKSLLLTFTPDAAQGRASVGSEPPLAGVRVDDSVALSDGALRRLARRAARRLERSGAASASPAASRRAAARSAGPSPMPSRSSYNARALAGLWRRAGRRAFAAACATASRRRAAPSFEVASPPLADVVRDINKYSNNVMAQQLFLTLGLHAARRRHAGQRARGAAPVARRALGAAAEDTLLDNGSGLSRETRLSAQAFARLLQRPGPAR